MPNEIEIQGELTYEYVSRRVRIDHGKTGFAIEYLDSRGDWRHWARVCYRPMALDIAERRNAELRNRSKWS